MSIKVLLETQSVETKENAQDSDDSIPDMYQDYHHKNTQIKTIQQLFGNKKISDKCFKIYTLCFHFLSMSCLVRILKSKDFDHLHKNSLRCLLKCRFQSHSLNYESKYIFKFTNLITVLHFFILCPIIELSILISGLNAVQINLNSKDSKL